MTVKQNVRFSPRRLGHGNLFVGELERSAQFYNKVCGLQEVYREPPIHAAFLSSGTSHHDIALMQISENERVGRQGHIQVPRGRGEIAGLNHLAWEMENEALLVDAYDRAKTAGVHINRTADHQVSHSVYLFDPDGNLHEFYADAAFTFPVGDIDNYTKKLLEVTQGSLYEGIGKLKPGNKLFDISKSIQDFVESNGFSVVRTYVGHGIGRDLHEDPQIPNFVDENDTRAVSYTHLTLPTILLV